jgi:2'-5' RNA ligase
MRPQAIFGPPLQVQPISGEARKMRLFIAININENTRNSLLALRDELSSRSRRGSYSLPENLHLTLAFLGECYTKQTAAAEASLDAVKFEPFEMLIDHVGRFGGQSNAIWWAGVNANDPLLNLYRDLSGNLAAAGFTIDDRSFSPHITLGRRVMTRTDPWQVEPFGETVHKIDLMKSERLGGKLTYTPVFSKSANS